jgi:RNA polymerase sigma-70 factor (ECF subfamily)
MTSESEQLWLERAKSGDREAFGELVRMHGKRMWKVALHLLGSSSEADDVVQETFLREFRAIDRFDGKSELSTWLYRITVNLSLNALRTRKRAAAVDIADPRLGVALTSTQPDPAGDAESRQSTLRLLEALDALSLTLRTTVVLVALEGLSHREVGEILGCAEGTVAWRIHEARRLLKERLNAPDAATTDKPEASPKVGSRG